MEYVDVHVNADVESHLVGPSTLWVLLFTFNSNDNSALFCKHFQGKYEDKKKANTSSYRIQSIC